MPHAIDSIEQQGREIYKADPNASVWIGDNDRASFFQLKSMLQGVLARGTARSAKHLAPYAAGKTGTTDDELDAWFVGFTNDVTVAIWVGYDNADGNRKTLGRGQTGGRVALPMFEPILQSVWAMHAPKTALSGPSKEAMRELVAVRIDPYTGDTDEYGEPRYDQCGRQIAQVRKAAPSNIWSGRWRAIRDTGSFPAARITPMDAAAMASTRTARRCSSSAGSRSTASAAFFAQSDNPELLITAAAPSRMARLSRTTTIPCAAPRRVDPDYFFGRRQY